MSRLLVLILGLLATRALAPAQSKLDLVNSFIGTTGSGESEYGGTLPTVGTPFAMTNWCPMTRENRIGINPYRYDDRSLIGFIGTHQPAIWMGDYGQVVLQPGTGPVGMSPDERAQSFSHNQEKATPYSYSVTSKTKTGSAITTTLAASSRCSLFRVDFQSKKDNYVFIEASRGVDAKHPFEGWIKIDPKRHEILGYNTDRFSYMLGPQLPNFKGYFVIQFDKPFQSFGTWNGNQKRPDALEEEGDHVGGYVYLGGSSVSFKVGTSFISVDQARDNLKREIQGWDVETTALKTKKTWEAMFDRVNVEGGTQDQQVCYYTAYYRSLQYPREFSEYGRYYSAFDDKIHRGVSYNDYSLWDTYRAEHPWFTLVAPERVGPMITSLLNMFDEGGWMPKWPNPTYTNIMIGTHADSVIADAVQKGFRGFDLQKAYQAVYKDAMVPPTGDTTKKWWDRENWTAYEARAGLSYYKQLGYVPVDKTAESVSNTLEGAYDDYCASVVAAAVHKEEDRLYFLKRSKNYVNVYNPTTGFMAPKLSDGTWGKKPNEGFTEGSPWTYLFGVQQDVGGLIELLGGREKFIQRLDENFDGGHYQHDNEPGHHYIYLYDYAGQPLKTQQRIWEHTWKNYRNTPDGLAGNDDCGQMSAWLLFTSMGFYPVCPGSGEYALGVPLFPSVTLKLPAPYRTTLKVLAPGLSSAKRFVKAVYWNGHKLETPFIKHADIVKGGTLMFEMMERPTS